MVGKKENESISQKLNHSFCSYVANSNFGRFLLPNSSFTRSKRLNKTTKALHQAGNLVGWSVDCLSRQDDTNVILDSRDVQVIPYLTHPVLAGNIWHICGTYLAHILGKSWAYFRCNLTITWAFFGYIMVVSVVYIRPILFRSCSYLGYMLDICWACLQHILSISRAYQGHAFDIPHSLFKANRYNSLEILAWSHSVFIQFSFCRKQIFVQPLLVLSIRNCNLFNLKYKMASYPILALPTPILMVKLITF